MTFVRKTAALALAASLGSASLGAVAPALAQTVAEFNPQSAVGDWLYDANGELVGSVYGLANGGRTVIVQWGSYLTPGRHLVSVPAADFAMVRDHVTLRTLTADALASTSAVD